MARGSEFLAERSAGRPRVPSAIELVVALVLVAAVATIGLEQKDGSVRRWAIEHPITIGLVAGLALVVLTVFGVERTVSRRESQRWAIPAREAINSWLFAADEAVRTIGAGIQIAAESLAEPPPERDLSECLRALAEQNPDALRDVSDLVRTQAGDVGVMAMTAVSIIARYSPLSGAVAMMFDEQRRFDDVAQTCRTMAWTNPLLSGQHREKALPLVVDQANRVGVLLAAIRNDLTDLRVYVLQTRPASSPTTGSPCV